MTDSNNSDWSGKRYTWIRYVIPSLGAAAIAAVVMYFVVSAYVMREAENIQDVLLSHRAVHLYIQRVMLPAFYRARDAGEISQNYYNPEILSSSFIVRSLHSFHNEERRKAGLPEIYYKLASDNPRNPVNKADESEMRLIRMFNEHKDLKSEFGTLAVGI